MAELKPCPFCGGEPFKDSCDRLIRIGCKVCNYNRAFHGLVQSEIDTGIPIRYADGKTSTDEWYDQHAHERAAEAWNRRMKDGERICPFDGHLVVCDSDCDHCDYAKMGEV